jgi:hypothetical protein
MNANLSRDSPTFNALASKSPKRPLRFRDPAGNPERFTPVRSRKSQDKEITMFSAIVSVCAWVGIGLFMWSVSDSLATIAKAMHRDASPTTLPTEAVKPS